VIKADHDVDSKTVTVVFDDAKTDINKIVEALEASGFAVAGKPEFLK